VRNAGLSTIFLMGLALSLLSSCIFTLPFDELSGGAPKPIAYFKLDEKSGFSAIDSVKGTQGLIDGEDLEEPTKWIPDGKRGGALDFPTEDGYVFFPDLSHEKFPRVATVSVWVKVHSYLPNDVSYIFNADEDDPTILPDKEFTPFELYVGESGVFYERVSKVGGERISTAPKLELNVWTFVAVGWSLPEKRAFLYVRGENKPAAPFQTGDLPPEFVLNSPYFYLSFAQGAIDEAQVFDRLLTEKELNALSSE
jgi:hypothetical protein